MCHRPDTYRSCIYLFICLLSPTRLQPRSAQLWLVGLVDFYMVAAAKCSYARMPDVADSRRGAGVNLHHPTSLSKEDQHGGRAMACRDRGDQWQIHLMVLWWVYEDWVPAVCRAPLSSLVEHQPKDWSFILTRGGPQVFQRWNGRQNTGLFRVDLLNGGRFLQGIR